MNYRTIESLMQQKLSVSVGREHPLMGPCQLLRIVLHVTSIFSGHMTGESGHAMGICFRQITGERGNGIGIRLVFGSCMS